MSQHHINPLASLYARYADVMEASPDAILLLDPDGAVRIANRRALLLFGAPRVEDLIGTPWYALLAEPDRARLHASGGPLLSAGIVSGIAVTCVRLNGAAFPAEVNSSVLIDPEGRPCGFVLVIRDVSERRALERALEASEARYRALVEEMPAIAYLAAPDESGSTLYISPQIETLTGFTPEEWLADPALWSKQLHPDDRDRVLAEARQSIASAQAFNSVYRLRARDGRVLWFHDVATLVHDDDGQPLFFQGVMLDITAHRQAEEELARERERLAIILRSISDAVVTTDRAGLVTSMNPAAEALTGWAEEEARGRPCEQFIRLLDERTRRPPDLPAGEAIAGGIGLKHSSLLLVTRGGQQRPVWIASSPLRDQAGAVSGTVLVIRDVTQQRLLEQERRQIETLASLRLLAGGVAHDFNNLLAVVLGNLSLLGMPDLPATEQSRARREAEVACERAIALTQQLLTFSRSGTPVNKKPGSLAALIEETAQFIVHGSSVWCELALARDLWPVEGDEVQLSQVFQNLVLNAVQAMPQGGRILIEGSNVVLSAGSDGAAEAVPLPDGRYVRIRVCDEGTGIAPEHLGKIFEPYFTTKPAGTGLGLAIVHSIIRAHGGAVLVDSAEGRGTVFTIYLPERAQPGPLQAAS